MDLKIELKEEDVNLIKRVMTNSLNDYESGYCEKIEKVLKSLDCFLESYYLDIIDNREYALGNLDDFCKSLQKSLDEKKKEYNTTNKCIKKYKAKIKLLKREGL